MKTAAAILALIMGAAPSWACDFVPLQSAEEEVFAWDVLFDGQVVGVDFVEPRPRSSLDWGNAGSDLQPYDPGGDFRGCLVTYRVVERFRGGDLALESINFQYFEFNECQAVFHFGDRQLVAARRQDGMNLGDTTFSVCPTFQFPEDELRATARRLRSEMLIW